MSEVKRLDKSIDDTFVSGVREPTLLALIDFIGRYHRPIAQPILLWPNGDSFMSQGGLSDLSDDFGLKF